jgi:polyphosphate kinase
MDLQAPADAPEQDNPVIEPAAPRYFNRELSWLAFNRRVLEEASNRAHPLLERLRFLSISASNLDEFFMVRVAGLKAHQALGVEERSADGLTPGQQLAAIILEADRLVDSQHQVWDDLQRALATAGMFVLGDEAIDEASEAWLDQYFREQIFPLLTPVQV